MKNRWTGRVAVAVAAALAVAGAGWSAAPAQAAEPVTITGTVLNSSGAPCASGYAYLYFWYSGEDGGWGWDDEGYVSGGSYNFSVSDARVGRAASVRAYCDADSYSAWFGGGHVYPSGPTASNTKALVAGVNNFGSLQTLAAASLSGRFLQTDGSALPLGQNGIQGGLRFYEAGAPSTDDYLDSCWADSDNSGNITDSFTNCTVPVGTFDVWTVADSWGDYVYPRNVGKIGTITIPKTGLIGQVFKLAAGPAAKLRSAPSIAGVAAVGNYLGANPGIWSDRGYEQTDLVIGYQWIVAGQLRSTAAVYQVQPQDAGQQLVLKVTATRANFAPAEAQTAAVAVSAAKETRSTATVTAKFSKLKKNKKGTVTVTVTGAAIPTSGSVSVLEGSKGLGSVGLKAKHHGKVKFKFKGLAKGSHTLTVLYGGNAGVAPASRVVTVKVK